MASSVRFAVRVTPAPERSLSKAEPMAKTTTKTTRQTLRAHRETKRPTKPKLRPVTLAEARTLAARARHPAKAMAAAPAARIATPPAKVALARSDAADQRDAEIRRRRRDYTDTLNIMKARGARPPRLTKTFGEARTFQPLQILAEGDSWFDYPAHARGGLIPRLATKLGVPIMSLADAGDEVRYMLGVEQRERLVREFQGGCPAGGPWDVLLFSGGGNDVVDNPLAIWLRDYASGLPARDLVHPQRYEAVLTLVRAGYEDLIELRDRLSPDTHLVFHAYDFAIPDGRGVCGGLLGPWLQPAFRMRGFPLDPPTEAAEVVRVMLTDFAAMLNGLTGHKKVSFVNGQGTLAPVRESWHNELHPSADGFNAFVELFRAKIQELFPGRVA
jgi:hypothetical protein